MATDTLTLPATIDTPRLRLRRPRLEDATWAFEAFAQDPEVARFVTWRPHKSLGDTAGFFERTLGDWRMHPPKQRVYVIERSADHSALGLIDCRFEGHPAHRASLGYLLARNAQGHGYMTEAAGALADTLLALPGIHRVWSVADVDNERSWRVMERIGMQREGILRRWARHPNVSDEPRDVVCYAKVR